MNLYLQAALFVIAGGVGGAAYNAALGSYVLSSLVAPVPFEAPVLPSSVAPAEMPAATPFVGPFTFRAAPTPRPTVSIPNPAPDRRPEISPFAPPSRSPPST